MIAVRQEQRPAMRLVLLDNDAAGQRGSATAVRIHFPDHAGSIRRINNYVLAAPTTAPGRCRTGEHLRLASADGNFQQPAIGEKGYVGAVWRPKRITCAFGPRH